MKEELISILGLAKDATDQKVIEAVRSNHFELRGKMGYVSLGFIEKLKRDGYFQYNPMRRCWECLITDEQMEKITRR